MGSKARGRRDAITMITACHARMGERIAELTEAADALAADPAAAEPREVVIDTMSFLWRTARRHIADEEESVFPRLRGADPAVDALIDALTADHREHEALLDTLRAAAAPILWAEGGATVGEAEAVAGAARALGDAYRGHSAREDDELVAAIRAHLTPRDRAAALADMQARRGHN